MNLKKYFVGGQITKVAFGPTFATLEGFSNQAEGAVSWWIRLEKAFRITVAGSKKDISVYDDQLDGATELIRLCSHYVSSFDICESGLKIWLDTGSNIEMIWSADEFGCAQVDLSTSDVENAPRLICSLLLPEDLHTIMG